MPNLGLSFTVELPVQPRGPVPRVDERRIAVEQDKLIVSSLHDTSAVAEHVVKRVGDHEGDALVVLDDSGIAGRDVAGESLEIKGMAVQLCPDRHDCVPRASPRANVMNMTDYSMDPAAAAIITTAQAQLRWMEDRQLSANHPS